MKKKIQYQTVVNNLIITNSKKRILSKKNQWFLNTDTGVVNFETKLTKASYK